MKRTLTHTLSLERARAQRREHRGRNIWHGVFGALVLLILWTGCGWAYIDPNAGGFVAQMLAPLLAVAASFIFYCRKQIVRFFKPDTRKIEQNQAPAQSQPPSHD